MTLRIPNCQKQLLSMQGLRWYAAGDKTVSNRHVVLQFEGPVRQNDTAIGEEVVFDILFHVPYSPWLHDSYFCQAACWQLFAETESKCPFHELKSKNDQQGLKSTAKSFGNRWSKNYHCISSRSIGVRQ